MNESSNILKSHDSLRERLLRVIKRNPKSIRELARDIKISPRTLDAFIRGDDNKGRLTTLCRIERFVEIHEVILGKME